MEGEAMNLIKVCLIVVVSLTYCYTISSRIPKGSLRFVSLLPIISILTLAPLILSSVFLQFYIGYFVGWIANFRLLLFAFGCDETLSIHPSISLMHFIAFTALPIKIQRKKPNPSSLLSSQSTLLIYLVCWYTMIQMYINYKQSMLVANPIVIHILYQLVMFFGIQVCLSSVVSISQIFLGQELEPQFIDPFLSTSVQNFWGKRWSRTSSGVLRLTIYEPARSFLRPKLGRTWSLHAALLSSFGVSGLMHELLFFYMTRRRPTWEATWFFLIQGVCTIIEIEVKKKASNNGWKLHPFVSTMSTLGFVGATCAWLGCAELIHSGEDSREIEEYIALVGWMKRIVLKTV